MRHIAGILLAAGRGTRFGGNKLLAPLADGTPLVLAAARALLGAVAIVHVVVRPDDRELAILLAAEGARIVECPEADRGMGYSLAAGVAASSAADAWLIALGDMPHIQVATHARVRDALAAGAVLAAPFFRGRRGHPVGFSAGLRAELQALRSDAGARELLARHSARLLRLDVDDPGILTDVDTPADMAPSSV